MLGFAATLLGLLKYAPTVLEAGRDIVAAVSGETIAKDAPAESVVALAEKLPAEQQAQVLQAVVGAKIQLQALDTQRFLALTEGDVSKLEATARPEIALRAMGVLTIFANGVSILFFATIGEFLLRHVYAVGGWTYPDVSLWALLAGGAPIAEMIWAPLLGSFWACVAVITKYMGCRERDKAQEYEIHNEAPLKSTDAVIAASGGAVANLIRAFKGAPK